MTSIHANHRAIAVAATALAITAIPAAAVSARRNQSARELQHVRPAASRAASSARSGPGRQGRAASGATHGVSIISVGLSRMPRTFTTGKDRRAGAVVKVKKPVTPADPSIFWMILQEASHATYDQSSARSRHDPTHKFSSGPYRRMLELLLRWLRARVFEGGIVPAIERAVMGTVPHGSATALRPEARRSCASCIQRGDRLADARHHSRAGRSANVSAHSDTRTCPQPRRPALRHRPRHAIREHAHRDPVCLPASRIWGIWPTVRAARVVSEPVPAKRGTASAAIPTNTGPEPAHEDYRHGNGSRGGCDSSRAYTTSTKQRRSRSGAEIAVLQPTTLGAGPSVERRRARDVRDRSQRTRGDGLSRRRRGRGVVRAPMSSPGPPPSARRAGAAERSRDSLGGPAQSNIRVRLII